MDGQDQCAPVRGRAARPRRLAHRRRRLLSRPDPRSADARHRRRHRRYGRGVGPPGRRGGAGAEPPHPPSELLLRAGVPGRRLRRARRPPRRHSAAPPARRAAGAVPGAGGRGRPGRRPSGVFAGDVPAAAATAGERLDRAAALARQLTQALRNAQLAVSGLAYAGATTTRTAGEPVRGRPGGVLNVRNGRDVRRLAGHPPGVRPHPGHAERAGRLLGWLDAGAASVEGDPLADSDAFTPAARDRWAYLLTVAKAAPATVDVSLAALVALGECLGLGPPDVARVDQPARAPRAGPASATSAARET